MRCKSKSTRAGTSPHVPHADAVKGAHCHTYGCSVVIVPTAVQGAGPGAKRPRAIYKSPLAMIQPSTFGVSLLASKVVANSRQRFQAAQSVLW